ncbi:MAG: glycosyltransferase [Lachnospiraceae bacterium]
MQGKIFWSQDEYWEKYISERYSDVLNSETDLDSIIVFLSFSIEKELSYEQVFSLDAQEICGITFSGKWISRCGGINHKLPAGHLYEFVCRLLEKAQKCRIIALNEAVLNTWDEEIYSFLYAYIFRYHLSVLHHRKMKEVIFMSVCNMMQQRRCFELFQQYMNFFLTEEQEFYSIANITAPFLILRGDNTCYGALRRFAEDLADSLIRQEQAVVLTGENLEQYDELPNYFYKGIVGFQTKALEIDFFKKLHGCKYQFWMDYPLHFQGILHDLPEEYYVLCQDANHAKLIQDYYHTENAIQFPPGGISHLDPMDINSDRPFDIVFVGSYFQDHNSALSIEQKNFYEFMVEHPSLTFEKALCEILKISEDESHTEEFIGKMRELKPACRAVIGFFREKIIRIILKAGYSIHVYGDEWKILATEFEGRLIVHPSVSVEESLQELKKAKIGLNIMSWHKAGMTERIANIMLSGAVCLSDETTFLRENLKDGGEILLFKLSEIDCIPQHIKKVLDDEKLRRHISQKGYEKAMQEYTWDTRAKQLISMAEIN